MWTVNNILGSTWFKMKQQEAISGNVARENPNCFCLCDTFQPDETLFTLLSLGLFFLKICWNTYKNFLFCCWYFFPCYIYLNTPRELNLLKIHLSSNRLEISSWREAFEETTATSSQTLASCHKHQSSSLFFDQSFAQTRINAGLEITNPEPLQHVCQEMSPLTNDGTEPTGDKEARTKLTKPEDP